MKNGALFPGDPPREKLAIFAKMSKIGPNINIRVVSLFYKNCAKFSKNGFWQIWSIFDLGGPDVYSSPFLGVTPVNWWQTTKKQAEICEK